MYPLRFEDPLRSFVGYSMTYSLDTQSVTLKAAGTSADLKWSGGSAAFINGVFIPSLAANATVDLSSTTVAPDLAAAHLEASTTFYMLVLSDASGNARVLNAGKTTLQIPSFDWSRWCPLAILKYANSTSAATVGTTALVGAYSTIYQLSHPIFPTAFTKP